jgi:hypothetical protein
MALSNDERRALDLLRNHAEFKATLVSLTMNRDLTVLEQHVHTVARRWFELARVHYGDASAASATANPRSVYSRAYYAAYNASKAVRYVVRGSVSLKGDDHRKVADLPDKFPDVDSWTSQLPLLYERLSLFVVLEHRLRADYDNWSDTAAENTLTPRSGKPLSRQTRTAPRHQVSGSIHRAGACVRCYRQEPDTPQPNHIEIYLQQHFSRCRHDGSLGKPEEQ